MRIVKNNYNQGTAQVLQNNISIEKRLSAILGPAYENYRERWNKAQAFQYRPPFPIHIDIELGYSCNLKCIMCPYGSPSYKHPDYFGKNLKTDLIKKVILEGVPKGLSSIRFSLLNEPLLHPELPDLIHYAKKNGIIDCFITTNGILLNETISEKLIDAGLTHLMISLDASTKETYEKIRVGGNLDIVIDNINNFLHVRLKKKASLPLLRVSFVRMSMNRHEETEFLKQWNGKADYIAVAGYLNNLGEAENGGTLYLNHKKLSDSQNVQCSQPWTRCAVFANGDVFPCCLNYGRKRPVGNIYEQSMADIWNSKKNQIIQDNCRDKKLYKNSVCLECISNRELLDEI